MPADNQSDIAALSVRLGALHEDVGEIRTVLGRLTEAINKLAVIEQQQSQTASAVERAFKAFEKTENRQAMLESRLISVEHQQVRLMSAIEQLAESAKSQDQRIKSVEASVSAIKQELPTLTKTSGWVERFVIAAAALAIGAGAKSVGLL